ncbi:MAG TPA: Maf family protein [Kiritimatiellia bacterium]|nr:Maf family protein [Kiritimatiellia bacterium]HRZ12783.1 Maf family protein [Kiritimatiellia bacterium]HSA18265.1 Maf family protein [Kiritimatiellia bacterium]
MNRKEQLVLASASPRRRAFLKSLGFRFRIVPPELNETPNRGERPAHYARRLSEDKAAEVAARIRGPAVIIAADTIVVQGRRILQKPRGRADAGRMLEALSGRWHAVISGLCVARAAGGRVVRRRSRTVRTAVEFKRLTREEIAGYIATGEPMDKAGAYAIQGVGSFMIRAIRGSYTNVVGLPVAELVDILEQDFGLVLHPRGLKASASRSRAGSRGGRTAGAR